MINGLKCKSITIYILFKLLFGNLKSEERIFLNMFIITFFYFQHFILLPHVLQTIKTILLQRIKKTYSKWH